MSYSPSSASASNCGCASHASSNRGTHAGTACTPRPDRDRPQLHIVTRCVPVSRPNRSAERPSARMRAKWSMSGCVMGTANGVGAFAFDGENLVITRAFEAIRETSQTILQSVLELIVHRGNLRLCESLGVVHRELAHRPSPCFPTGPSRLGICTVHHHETSVNNNYARCIKIMDRSRSAA
jgi:hypothetical protein